LSTLVKDDLNPGRFLTALQRESTVRDQSCPVPRDQQSTHLAGEPCQVVQISGAGDQQAVQFCLMEMRYQLAATAMEWCLHK
jgi:hypothetical protein